MSAGYVIKTKISYNQLSNLINIGDFNFQGSTFGLSVSSINQTATNFNLTCGNILIPLQDYADNAAALASGMIAGNWYRTGGTVKIVT